MYIKILTTGRVFPGSQIMVASGDRGVEDRGDLICIVLIFFLKVGKQYFHVSFVMTA